MSDPRIINPGKTVHIGSPNHLSQMQHKGDRVDIVNHFDHDGLPVHSVMHVDSSGTITDDGIG